MQFSGSWRRRRAQEPLSKVAAVTNSGHSMQTSFPPPLQYGVSTVISQLVLLFSDEGGVSEICVFDWLVISFECVNITTSCYNRKGERHTVISISLTCTVKLCIAEGILLTCVSSCA